MTWRHKCVNVRRMKLSELRRERGAAAVRAVIAAAVAEHGTIKAAAEALGVFPHVLRRSAKSAGLVLPHDPVGIPKGSPGYAKRWGHLAKAAAQKANAEK